MNTVQRPVGITILAVLSLISGAFGLLGACGVLGLGALLGGAVGKDGAAVIGVIAIIFGIFTLGSALLSLLFAYGAWFLKPWAWFWGIIAQGISAVSNLFNLISAINNGTSVFGSIVGLAISGVIIYYLFTPEVKRAFGRV
jgi:uncharacterized membrane protein (DUF2068 family)